MVSYLKDIRHIGKLGVILIISRLSGRLSVTIMLRCLILVSTSSPLLPLSCQVCRSRESTPEEQIQIQCRSWDIGLWGWYCNWMSVCYSQEIWAIWSQIVDYSRLSAKMGASNFSHSSPSIIKWWSLFFLPLNLWFARQLDMISRMWQEWLVN